MATKIVITNRSSVSDITALTRVQQAMCAGRVSLSKNGPCYCFVTVFQDGTRIYAERTKTGTDTFTFTLSAE